MDLYEHQGKELLGCVGVPVPEGRVAFTVDEAVAAAEELGGRVAVKAQVHTGGRGKAGGIRLVEDSAGAGRAAADILGMEIRGHMVGRVLVEKAGDIERELYAAIVLDRGERRPLAMLSGMGGMDVEQIARDHTGAMARVHLDPLVGWKDFVGRRLAFEAGLEQRLVRPLTQLFARLWQAFVFYEATLVEINPLAVTEDGGLSALDCKFTVDNNALFRHPDLAGMRDVSAADPQEQMAREKGVTYVKLEGDVGILGNGAGLVMSTLDVVANAGGRPANFLDVGGGAKAEEIVDALEVITSDEKVRVIFFNIFGGITRCDEVARGILTAVDRLQIRLPIVVRLDGTNAEEGRRLVTEARLPNLYSEPTMTAAARRAVALAEA
ncbi:MAG: ADP-forming succinate--CoA ligase subunit beta [Thermoleophilia bacterium]